jgi:hypothetical protein
VCATFEVCERCTLSRNWWRKVLSRNELEITGENYKLSGVGFRGDRSHEANRYGPHLRGGRLGGQLGDLPLPGETLKTMQNKSMSGKP